MPRRRLELHWFIDHYEVGHRSGLTSRQARELTIRSIERPRRGEDRLLVWVVGLGFLMDSYVLFTSNTILPMLGYCYWHSATHTGFEIAFNAATLGGCIFGMILFGFLADHFGRRKLYGVALIFLIIGTYSLVTSSVGFVPVRHDFEGDFAQVDWETRGSMNIIAWLLWSRFVSGVGLGGDYPLTATIVAEFAPTIKRGRMLAFVFFMQAIGIAAGSIVTLIVVAAAKAHQPIPDARTIDQVWRWIIGISLVVACLAMVLRMTIPESPRYTLDVMNDQDRAFIEANLFRNAGLQSEANTEASTEALRNIRNPDEEAPPQRPYRIPTTNPRTRQTWPEYLTPAQTYFITNKKWHQLAGTSIAWFSLDIAFYALSLNSPQMVSKLWYHAPSQPYLIKIWNADFSIAPTSQDQSIYTILLSNSWHSLVVTSTGALIGGLTMIHAINHFSRKKFQTLSFIVLGILFLITGPVYWATVFRDEHGAVITLYCLCELVFYLGPNTLTFIYPVEIFPTPFRATCHGLSAASGKLGSLIIELVLAYLKPNGHSSGSIDNSGSDPNSNWLGWALMFFALPMFMGALVTHFLLPEVQFSDNVNKELEEIEPLGEAQPSHASRTVQAANASASGGMNGTVMATGVGRDRARIVNGNRGGGVVPPEVSHRPMANGSARANGWHSGRRG